MDLVKVLVELRNELDILNGAILSLERLQQVKPRRGRPQRVLSGVEAQLRSAVESGARVPAGPRKAQKAR